MRGISPNITKPIDIVQTPIITPAEVGAWLNLSPSMVTAQTALINQLILSTTEIVEKYTWLALRRTTFIADYDLPQADFITFLSGDLRLLLERAPIIALTDITKIEYLDETGVYVEFDKGAMTVDGLYENVTEKHEQRQWASVFFRESIPFDASRVNAYKIRITFISGFTLGTDPITDIPSALKTGMLMIIAYYYINRGDCSDCGCDLSGYPVPCDAKGMIDMFSVAKTVIGGAYTPSSGSGWGGLC